MDHDHKVYSPGVGTFIAFFVILLFTLAGMIVGSITNVKQVNMGTLGGTIVGFIVGVLSLALIGKKLVREK
jgi:hypothetical protein